MNRLNWTLTGLGVLATLFLTLAAADELPTLRNGIAIDEEMAPAAMLRVIEPEDREKRSYLMQPPTIPHKTRGYKLNLLVNKCMSCHARSLTGETRASMISVTHYMNREGNFLAGVSPRRYSCTQCHVDQTAAQPVIENTFEDMDDLLEKRSEEQQED
jgi:cytochrome c-type protein NapB